MRPAGEIRQAAPACFPLQGEGCATWHDAVDAMGRSGLLNPQAPGERLLVRRTVEHLVQEKKLVRVKPVPVAGSRRPAMGYARPAQRAQPEAGVSLAQVLTAWRK